MSTKPSLILTRLDVQRLERLIESLDEKTQDSPGVLALQDELAEQRERLPAFATLHFQGHTLTLDDWVAGLQAVAGPLRTQAMPWPLLRVLGLLSPTLRSLWGMRYLWQRPHQLDNTALRRSFTHMFWDAAAGRMRSAPEVEALSAPG